MANAGVEITPKRISSGSRIRTAIQLKKSWTVAPAIASLNSWGRVMWPIETIVLVTVVPMLAPMMTGMAAGTGSVPVATSVTTSEVVVEDDWTRLVTRMPVMSPRSGLPVAVRRKPSRSKLPCPMALMPSPISSSATTKTAIVRNSPSRRSQRGRLAGVLGSLSRSSSERGTIPVAASRWGSWGSWAMSGGDAVGTTGEVGGREKAESRRQARARSVVVGPVGRVAELVERQRDRGDDVGQV